MNALKTMVLMITMTFMLMFIDGLPGGRQA